MFKGASACLLLAALCLGFASCASSSRSKSAARIPEAEALGRQSGARGKAKNWSSLERRTVELSFIALAGCWQTDPELVAETVRDLLASMLPRQELVWGPAVHLPGPEVPAALPRYSDALVFISRDRDSGEYYVVFRGTNTISAAEWIFQDFMVQKMVPWLEIQAGSAPAAALVSDGTARAILLRRDLQPGPGVKGEGLSFAAALVSILDDSKGRCVMHFTGHSLGGLLSSAMALWFVDYLDASGRQGLAAKLVLDAHGYAGPTAGNSAFAAYLESRVPANHRYVNELDVAPRAWNEESMATLPDLYLPNIDLRSQAFTKSLYDLCLGLVRDKGYVQPGGSVAVPSWVAQGPGGLYLLEAAYQHSIPYLDMLLPERKERILAEVIRPLIERLPVKEFLPLEFLGLISGND